MQSVGSVKGQNEGETKVDAACRERERRKEKEKTYTLFMSPLQ